MKYFIGILLLWALPIFALAANLPAVIINEILPSPAGPDDKEEWIEILNKGDAAADISGWKIEDVAGKNKTYIFPKGTIVNTQEFLILRRPISRITLNNEGDGLKLFQLDGAIVNAVNYGKAPKGESYGFTKSGWAWGKTPTPGKPNVSPLVEAESQPAAGGKQTSAATAGISLRPLSAAASLAIFSGIIILILKRKTHERPFPLENN